MQGMRNRQAFIDEAFEFRLDAVPPGVHRHWTGLTRVDSYPPSSHVHSFNPPNKSYDGSKFDHKLIYKNANLHGSATFDARKLERDVVVDIVFDNADYNYSLKKVLNEELFRNLDLPQQFIPNKENNMSSNGRQLLTPESPIESKDLSVALRALEYGNGEEILDAVALVQSLTEGQRLVQARKLKPQDVGCFVKVVAGAEGYLSDLSEDFGRGGPQKAVINGRMYDLRNDDLVVVSAPDQD